MGSSPKTPGHNTATVAAQALSSKCGVDWDVGIRLTLTKGLPLAIGDGYRHRGCVLEPPPES